MNNRFVNIFFFISSFLIVAFSQGAWFGKYLGFVASVLGYLVFWVSICKVKRLFVKSLLSLVWFFSVQLVWLSWFTSNKYQGNLIFVVYGTLAFIFALQFMCVSYLVLKEKNLKFFTIFLASSFIAIFEWIRLYILCGFPFNQIGMSLASNLYSMQLASVLGVFGLSFYVIFVNLTGLKAFMQRSLKTSYLWIILAVFPYLFGYFHINIYKSRFEKAEKLNVCLVQTAILPEEKNLWTNLESRFVSPILQWQRIINFINQNDFEKLDLIVLPEAAVCFRAKEYVYPLELTKDFFEKNFGSDIEYLLPFLKEPFAKKIDGNYYVSNSFFCKAISNIYRSDLAIGLDDIDFMENRSYNSAFFFSDKIDTFQRYEKQVLVPMGEYIPFSFLEKLALKKYGIASAFSHGKNNKIFSDKKFSFSICYEEVFSNLMRSAKKMGSKCFVNLTNDAYFYNSKLYLQHFEHAKIRAVENGNPLIRACNTAVSATIDSFGRVINAIYKEDEASGMFSKANLFSYKTLYSLWGDYLVVFVSFCFIGVYFYKKRKAKKESVVQIEKPLDINLNS